MSIEAVTSRIQQIMAMPQELATGGVTGGASTSTATAGTASPTATTGASTSFSDALASAQGTATPGSTTGVGTTGAGTTGSTAGLTTGNPATGATDPRIQAMVAMANSTGYTQGNVEYHDQVRGLNMKSTPPVQSLGVIDAETSTLLQAVRDVRGKNAAAFAENNMKWHHKNKVTDQEAEALLAAIGGA